MRTESRDDPRAPTPRQVLDRAMHEDQLLETVMDALARFGWLAHHVRRSDRALQMGQGGFPDVVAVRGERVLIAELKREKGEVTAAQVQWLGALEDAGAEAVVVRPSGLDSFLESIR